MVPKMFEPLKFDCTMFPYPNFKNICIRVCTVHVSSKSLAYPVIICAASYEQRLSNMHKMRRFRSSCACAKYHPGLYSPFFHSVVFTVVDSEDLNQIARMRRLIWTYVVRICPKTRFRRARPIYYVIVPYTTHSFRYRT